MKKLLFLSLISILMLPACINKKRGTIPSPIVQDAFVSPGVYALRMCYENKPKNGLEVRVYSSCQDELLERWNHLMYFEFVGENRVDYNSLNPKRKSKAKVKWEDKLKPYYTGTFKVYTDQNTGSRRLKMNLSSTLKKKQKGKKKMDLDFLVINQDSIQLETVVYYHNQFRHVYDLNELFGNETTFLYTLECFDKWDTDCQNQRSELATRVYNGN